MPHAPSYDVLAVLPVVSPLLLTGAVKVGVPSSDATGTTCCGTEARAAAGMSSATLPARMRRGSPKTRLMAPDG
ncbi:hypothetical protein GCM10010937_00970 [Gluconobacter japonicus]|uniref:Secreted protein n=1 Tax=Gluconobacter japonicus TaxID=376620 RepID=A0ABQ5WDZ2_GLUJA|nr:hypothetical protein GCM10010937_00970 [Gluconobacter japonicus]